MRQKYAALLEITSGLIQEDLIEEYGESRLDCRPYFNVPFSFKGHGDNDFCVATELARRTLPEDKIFSPKLMSRIQQIKRNRGRRREWSNFMDSLSERKEGSQTSTIWRLAGGVHFLNGVSDAIAFVEYDTHDRTGYELIISAAAWALKNDKATVQVFRTGEEDVKKLCSCW